MLFVHMKGIESEITDRSARESLDTALEFREAFARQHEGHAAPADGLNQDPPGKRGRQLGQLVQISSSGA
jgi:hypothetical protein